MIPNTKAASTDRVLKLKQREGVKALDSKGLVDPRLFTGENNLHIVMDPESLMWSFRYEHGMIPNVFKDQRYTTFNAAYDVAKTYFSKRNIDIAEVIY